MENINHIEIFNYGDKETVNKLLSVGWSLLKVTQYKDEQISFGQIVIGCSKEVYEQTDSSLMENDSSIDEDNDLPF